MGMNEFWIGLGSLGSNEASFCKKREVFFICRVEGNKS